MSQTFDNMIDATARRDGPRRPGNDPGGPAFPTAEDFERLERTVVELRNLVRDSTPAGALLRQIELVEAIGRTLRNESIFEQRRELYQRLNRETLEASLERAIRELNHAAGNYSGR